MKIVKVNLLIILLATLLIGCQNKRSSRGSNPASLTSWGSGDKAKAGFSKPKKYKGQATPPGMVMIEGGTFTMGSVQDDVLFDWNTTPVKMQVRSFFLDEVEVTNAEYLFYLEWTERVFPKSNEQNKHIYTSILPDTLVWRNTLGKNELLTENYLRHPSYSDYPVVGVSWKQANDYCTWRSDRVSEKTLIDKGILDNVYSKDSLKLDGNNYFSTNTYLQSPTSLFQGDSSVYKKGIPIRRKKGEKKPSKGEFSGRHVKVSDGIISPKYRLPTEAEWEYAAKADVENREYNNIRGRKKYAWNSKYSRNKSKGAKGDQLANFKQGRGDYSGPAGWSSDGGAITVAVGSYEANAFGLYDMSGNVAEWVADVYRPIIDTEANDFNYYRGNVFTKKKIDENGKVVIVDYNTVIFDTLDNGRIVPLNLPGTIQYIPITKQDAFMKTNYEKSYNIDSKDGDLASTKLFEKDEDELDSKPRMYNSPIIPNNLGESGLRMQEYDDEYRTTLISDDARVYKGGSWKDREYWLDPAQRRHLPGYMATSFIGFRCATDKLGAIGPSKGKRTRIQKSR